MSYIFGIVDFSENEIREEDFLKLKGAVQEDGFISEVEVSGNYAFGYSYLSNRDAHCAVYNYKHLVLLADIRIYNPEKLKTYFDFENEYDAFAKAFLKWGVQCANYINGDFAVAVLDKQNNEVHLIRDHIGVRPLTYSYIDGRLIFASHEFSVAKSGLIRSQLSEKNILNRLLWFHSDYRICAFQDVFKVVPGIVVSFSQHKKWETTYWLPGKIKTNRTITFEDAVVTLRQLLVKATVARIEPGKTGVHVSGGLDSTGVACILADNINDKNRITGYSWTPEELNDAGDEQNEKEFIDAFSKEKGVPVRYLKLESDEYAKDSVLPDFDTMHIEYPTIRSAGQDQVTTLFSGWGGDEILSLSTRGTFNHFIFNLKFIWLYRFIRKYGIRSCIYYSRTEILPLIVPFGLLPSFRGSDWSGLKLFQSSVIRRNWKYLLFHNRKNVYGYGNRKKFVLNLLGLYHLPSRMDTWALYAEKYGFEYKYPLLDKDVLEFWFSLPIAFTYEKLDSRLLYREVMKGILTESIRARRDKSETLRIKYSLQNMMDGKAYFDHLFNAIPADHHVSIFKTDAIRELFSKPIPENRPDGWLHVEKLCLYLRMVELAKKYIHA